MLSFLEMQPRFPVADNFSTHTQVYLHHPLAEMEPGLPLQQGSLPRVGYGCWNLGPDMAATCVKHAIR